LDSPVVSKQAVKKAATPTPARLAPKLQVAKARPPAAPVRLAKAPAPSAKPGHKVEMARAQAVKAAVRKIELARAAAAKAAAHKLELARADTRAKAARAAKAARQEQLRLAQAEARGRAEARAEARAEVLAQARAAARAHVQLAKLARAPARAAPARTKAHASPVELARFDRKARPRREPPVQHVPVKARKTPRAVEPAYRRAPASMAPQPSPTGLMKVSTTPHCGGAHPCVDPALGAAERQLARAYQGARAAGVPDAQLQRQQQRWLAARSAAAREAPWAVRDVYLARIAELNGLAHDAKSDGY